MKIITKIILITVIMITLIFNMPLYAKAFDNIIEAGDNFLNIQQDSSSTVVTIEQDKQDKLKGLSNTVSGVLLTIALGVTLISAVVMGINFTIQSVEDKAKIKESMIPWIIGIFISFGAFGIWKLTMSIFYKL